MTTRASAFTSRPDQVEAVQLALKSAVTEAEAQLKEIGIPWQAIAEIAKAANDLESDREFWRYQAHALAVFVAPGTLTAFRVANSLESYLAVGDRFDIGPLLRSVTFPNRGYVLSIAEDDIRLLELSADEPPITVELELPPELDGVLEIAAHDGRFDQRRADGATGQKIEQLAILPSDSGCRARANRG